MQSSPQAMEEHLTLVDEIEQDLKSERTKIPSTIGVQRIPYEVQSNVEEHKEKRMLHLKNPQNIFTRIDNIVEIGRDLRDDNTYFFG